MKKDIYGHQQRYERWKENILQNPDEELTKKNFNTLVQYVFDMEKGINVSNKNVRGARGYPRLNNLRQRISQMMRMLQERGIKDVLKIKENQLADFFSDFRKGTIKTLRGECYKSVSDYVKVFKAFWHWNMKVNKKKGIIIEDVTEELDTKYEEKPVWVYLSEKQINELFKKCKKLYLPLLEFLYDSGARVTETFSLNVRDVSQDGKGEVFVNISNEVAKTKTGGRKIKLILSGKKILEYIQEKNLKEEDYLFPFNSVEVNNYLKNLGKDVFGVGYSEGGEKYSNLSMYDFRHNSACFFITKYKTSSNIMYRFGWKTEKYIYYYSEFLGLKDSISEEDLYDTITKTQLEKEVAGLKERVTTFEDILQTLCPKDKMLVYHLEPKPFKLKKISSEAL